MLPDGVRDLGNESAYEYGSRAGFWRIMRILERYGAPATFYCCAAALERSRMRMMRQKPAVSQASG